MVIQMNQNIELIFRPAQICSTLNISRSTLWRLVKRGELPEPIKLGGRAVGFPKSEIEDFINQRKMERTVS